MSLYDNSEYVLQEVQLVRGEIVEIPAASNVGLQTPRQLLTAVVVEVAWRHRESHLYVEHIAYASLLHYLFHLAEVWQIATIVSHKAGHSRLFAHSVDADAVVIAGSQRFLHIHWLACPHRHDGESGVRRWWRGDVNGIHVGIVYQLLGIRVPFTYMVALGITAGFVLTTAHDSHYLRALHLVEGWTRFLLGHFSATDKSPIYLFDATHNIFDYSVFSQLHRLREFYTLLYITHLSPDSEVSEVEFFSFTDLFSLLQTLVDLVDVVEHVVATQLFLAAGDEVRRQFHPTVFQRVHPLFGIHAGLNWAQLVGLGEDDAEGHATLAQPVYELTVNLLLVVAHVDKYKNVSQLWTLQNIAGNHLLQLFLYGLRTLGEAIARQVDQIPLVVDDEMVDKQGLSRCGRCLGESLVVAEHVDEARLSHVTSADEGILSRNYSARVGSYKLDFGVQYTQRVSKKDWVTLGLTYSPKHNLGASADMYQVKTNAMDGSLDTTSFSVDKAFELPHMVGAGLMWNHAAQWKVGLDYTLQMWEDLKAPVFDGRNYVLKDGCYSNRHKINLGAQYCYGEYSRRFLQRVQYRAGVSYTTPYVKINGQDGPKEFAVSAGFGIPIVNSYNSRSFLNISGQWVKRSAKDLIKENIFRINIGFTFNEDWFKKWKMQ